MQVRHTVDNPFDLGNIQHDNLRDNSDVSGHFNLPQMSDGGTNKSPYFNNANDDDFATEQSDFSVF